MSHSQDSKTSEDRDIGSSSEQEAALDELFIRRYDQIRTLAARVRWSGTNPTLNPTALAHEAYIKLRKNSSQLAAKPYDEVIKILAHAMHQILIDASRRKKAGKRTADDTSEAIELPVEDAIMVSSSLQDMERANPRQAQVIRCRFLLSMTAGETATALGVSKRTVEREWQEAKARFRQEFASGRD